MIVRTDVLIADASETWGRRVSADGYAQKEKKKKTKTNGQISAAYFRIFNRFKRKWREKISQVERSDACTDSTLLLMGTLAADADGG